MDYICILGKVEGVQNFKQKLEDETITLDSKMAVALIRARSIKEPLSLVWKWYDPDKTLSYTSPPVHVNKQGKYLEYFIAWNNLKNNYFNKKSGTWTVLIIANDKIMVRKDFSITKANRGNQK